MHSSKLVRGIALSAAAIGIGLLLVSLFAPQLRLGQQEGFLLYQFAGITRRFLAFFGLLLVLAAISLSIFPAIQRDIDRFTKSIMPTQDYMRLIFHRAHHIRVADFSWPNYGGSIPRTLLTIAATMATMLIFFLVLWALPDQRPGSQTLFISEMTRLYEFVGSSDQRMAHISVVIATALFCAAGFWIGRQDYVSNTLETWEPSISIWACIGAALILYFSLSGIVTGTEVSAALLLAPILILSAAFSGIISQRLNRWLIFFLSVYLTCIILPGMLSDPIPFIANSGDVLAQLELHIAAMTMPGVGISGGQDFFTGVPYNYGLMMPSLISLIDLKFGAMSIDDQLHFVQACQILFTVLAAASYLYYRPNQYLGVFVALLLAAPYWSSAGLGIWHANQTGFRSLGLPLGMLALVFLGRYRPLGWQWLAGSIGGIAILINPETSIALGVGYFIYFLLIERRFPLASFARMAAAIVGTLAVYFIVYRTALGRLPFGGDLADIVLTLRRHTSGDFGSRLFLADPAGEHFYLVPFVLIMLAHAIAVLVDAFIKRGKETISHENAIRCAAAGTLIVWLSYYFGFPNWWQIWTHLFLYGFLVIGLFDSGAPESTGNQPIGKTAPLPRRHIPAASAIVILFLALMIAKTNSRLIQMTQEFVNPSWLVNGANATVVSGVLMPADMGSEMRAKVTKLEELYKEHNGRVIYLTFNSAFIPTMSRIFEPIPERDPFNNINGEANFGPAMDGILAKRPAVILIDAPTGPLAVNGARKDFQDRMRAAIERDYRKSSVESGWELWVPKSAS